MSKSCKLLSQEMAAPAAEVDKKVVEEEDDDENEEEDHNDHDNDNKEREKLQITFTGIGSSCSRCGGTHCKSLQASIANY